MVWTGTSGIATCQTWEYSKGMYTAARCRSTAGIGKGTTMTESDAARNEPVESAEAANPADLTATDRKAEPLTSDQVIDITLGAAVVAAEFITQAMKHLQENGPAYLDVLESKGKPV